ncbi:MAG: hypothetical protein ABI340_05150 [Nitrososphaera sp.]|jgi:hypothetical protein
MEKDITDVKLEHDHWKAADPRISGHKWEAINEPSEMRVHTIDGKLVKLKFFKGSIVQIISKKITYNAIDVAEGTL